MILALVNNVVSGSWPHHSFKSVSSQVMNTIDKGKQLNKGLKLNFEVNHDRKQTINSVHFEHPAFERAPIDKTMQVQHLTNHCLSPPDSQKKQRSFFNYSQIYQSTPQIAVMRLCTNDVAIFLHFHAFLRADSGMGNLRTPALISLKNPTEPPVVKITELSSMTERFIVRVKVSSGHGDGLQC